MKVEFLPVMGFCQAFMEILVNCEVFIAQQYQRLMIRFYGLFFGPFPEQYSVSKFRSMLSEVDFGYKMERVGIRQYSPSKWSITFQRTLLGTDENFKIDCELIRDTCRVYLDRRTWGILFP